MTIEDMQYDEVDIDIYDSKWWDTYWETEYAWEMENGIYDPPM